MADNYEFLEPSTAPPGTVLRTQRAIDVGANRLATAAVLFDSSGTEIDLASETTLAAVLAALASVAVSGPVTDAELRAAPVPVAGTVTASGPLTDAELRATAVPISAASLPLAPDAATETTLAQVLAALTPATPRAIVAVSVNATSSGDNTVVAAVPDNRIRLIACHLHGNGDVNVSWKSGAATTLAAAMPLGVKGNGFVLPHAPTGEYWQRTASGEALGLHLSAAVAVTGSLIYELEAA